MTETQQTPAKVKKPWQRHPWDRYFYPAYAIAASLFVIAAFGPTYFFRLGSADQTFSTIIHLHAVVFSLWMVLWVVQTLLVEKGRTDLHKMLGIAGIFLALAIVVVGYLTMVSGARTGYLGPGVERDLDASRAFMAAPMRDLVWFVICFVLAIYLRGTPETHKRLMLVLFNGGLILVVLARVPMPFTAIAGFGFSLSPIIYDLISRRRLHWVYVVGFLMVPVSQGIAAFLVTTEAWRRFVDMLIG